MLNTLFLFLNLVSTYNDQAKGEVDLLHEGIYEIMDAYPDSAIVQCDIAIDLAKKRGYTWGEANGYYIKGFILESIQNKAVAGLLMYLKAAHILEKETDPESVKTYSSLMLNSGSILRIHGKYDLGIELYIKGLNKIRDMELEQQELKLLYNLSYMYRDQEEYGDAMTTINQTIDLAKSLDNDKILFDAYNMLGLIYLNQNNKKQAEENFKKVVGNQSANPSIKAHALNNLGDLYSQMKFFSSAIEFYLKADELGKKLDNSLLSFYTKKGLSQAYFGYNKLANAEEDALQAIDLLDHITQEYKHLEIYHLMSQIQRKLGREDKVILYQNQYFDETQQFFLDQQSVIDVKAEFQIDLLLAGFYSELKVEENQLRYRNSIVAGVTILLFFLVIVVEFMRYYMIKTGREIKTIVDRD